MHSDLDDNDRSLHHRPRQWVPFEAGNSPGANLSMVILVKLWYKWVKDYLGRKTGRIIILDSFTKNIKEFQEDKNPTGISWTNGAMFDSAKALLIDGMKILQPDCPILLSNFVKKALNDEINLERNDLIKYVKMQRGGDKLPVYITKKQKGSRTQARAPRERKRGSGEKEENTDNSPAPEQKRPKHKFNSDAASGSGITTEGVDLDVASEKRITQLMMLARKHVPNVGEFKTNAINLMLDVNSTEKDAIETFLYFKKRGLIKKIDFVSRPPKTKQPIENITEEPPPTIEHDIFEAMDFEPGSVIDKLFKKAITAKPEKNGELIVDAKLQIKGKDLFDVLVYNRNPLDLTEDDITDLIPGSVSSNFNYWSILSW